MKKSFIFGIISAIIFMAFSIGQISVLAAPTGFGPPPPPAPPPSGPIGYRCPQPDGTAICLLGQICCVNVCCAYGQICLNNKCETKGPPPGGGGAPPTGAGAPPTGGVPPTGAGGAPPPAGFGPRL